ncbi:MAG: BamA/TamA family outer membrane protein [Deltaproteobacteria bacterium]|nr:BamA/TamA family outer membrane protein [Deltaproteobacteria bacterium]
MLRNKTHAVARFALTVCVAAIVTLAVSERQVNASSDLVRVAASERYNAGRVHRFVLGGGYRDLWQAEIELPLLDLSKEGGGLVPTRRFGGLQTSVLGFKGADGRTYSFRGTDKDPSAVLDSLFHDTIVQTIVQDQMAAQHPAGPPVAGVLTEAAGVLTVKERMVVMPDDPLLGEFREEFAGMVGTFFEYPQPSSDDREGFHGATEIINSKKLYARLEQGNNDEVDVEAFLRARLLDIFLGDFDRHRKQWRWAKLPGNPRWQPIPEDRDMAFVRYDGVGPRIGKLYVPILQRYSAEYPFIKGLTLHGWEQDRWLLPRLSWQDWEPIISDIQARITDETIDRAIAMLPPEYEALDGEHLRAEITGRRDNLPEAARRFYEHLARQVDIQTSNAPDDFLVQRSDDGRMLIEVREQLEAGAVGPVHYRREFDSDDTREVRLYLRGGDDRVRVEGGSGPIRLRVIAADGQNRVDDSAGGGTRVYDSDADTGNHAEVIAGPGTRVDRRPYELPPSESGFVDVENVPPRDWGSDTIPLPEAGYEKDVGVFLGVAAAHTRYGFRKHPWSSKHSFGVGYATEANKARVRYMGQFRPENSILLGELDLQYSGIEVVRFYGVGNETNDNRRDSFYRVTNRQIRVRPSISLPILDERIRLSAGPHLQLSRTSNGSRLIDDVKPYGDDNFQLIGALMNLQFDTRRSLTTDHANLELPFSDNPAAGYPTSGFFVDFTARFSPPVIDVEKSYGTIKGSVSAYLSVGENARATLGIRVGGQETFGRTPFFDLAYIGGGRFFSGTAKIRGFRTRRFAGDSSLYTNVDLRIFLARIKVIVPGDFGVHGYFDVGRVFVDGENSNDWHPSGGAGVWFSPLVRTNTISVSVAHSPEETLAYVRFGFHY